MRQLQRLLGRLAILGLGPASSLYLRVHRGYRFATPSSLPKTYRRLVDDDRPLLVCANHLTMIDSLLIHHALGSMLGYAARYRRLCWNVAAAENVQKTRLARVLTYLGKTIAIDREGSPEHHDGVLHELETLLREREPVTLFPEGTRSRTGRIEVDQVRYGVGRLLQRLPEARVLCVYLRAEQQQSHGFAPARHDVIHFDYRVLEPKTEQAGLCGARDLARQVIYTLKRMEESYFGARLEEN